MYASLEVNGDIWEYVFLVGDGRLTQEDREFLVIQTAEMYYGREKRRNIKRDSFEGAITTDRKSYYFVNFFGQRFDTELEGDFGKMKLSGLIAKVVNPDLN